jgi:hypothetical protein
MTSLFYVTIFVLPIVTILSVLFYLLQKQNSHTELYSEGLHDENDGRYETALRKYEDALSEIRKLRLDDKFGHKIAARIRVLRTTIEYENNFQHSHTDPS